MTTSSLINTNVDFGYYSFSLKNSTDEPVLAQFQEDRNAPVLLNCQDWQVGVVRFKIPSSGIPLFKFETDGYWIGISNGQGDADLHFSSVPYVPDLVSNDRDDIQNQFIYTYNQFILMLNATLNDLWLIVKADPAYTYLSLVPAETPPYFELEKTGSHIKLVLPMGTVDTPPLVNYPTQIWRNFAPNTNFTGLNISISPKLQYLLSGFNNSFNRNGWGAPILKYRLDFSIRQKDIKQVQYTAFMDPLAVVAPADLFATSWYAEVYEDYSCLYLWSFLSRILLITSMPVEAELIGASNSEGKNLTQRILTDFETPNDRDPALRDYIFFQPSGPIRYTNFQSNGVLNKTDLKIYFQDNALQIYPVKILPGSEVNVKLGFKRRKNKSLLQYSGTKPNFFI